MSPAPPSSPCSPLPLTITLSPRPPIIPTPQIHGDAIITHEQLAAAAERLQRRLKASWRKVDELLMATRCVVDFLSNTQGM